MKVFSTSSLSIDDLLIEVKRHVGQLEFILRECKNRGVEENAHSIIREYPLVSISCSTYELTDLTHKANEYGDRVRAVPSIRAVGSGGEHDEYECDGMNCPERAHDHKVLL
jgi:hypothetical protein